MTTLQPETEMDVMAPPNKGLAFRVIADSACGMLFYKMEPANNGSDPYYKNGKVVLPHGSDWYDISFQLIDRDSSRQIEFDQTNPICAHIGGSCPPSGSGINTDGQISVTEVKQKSLTIQNKNQDPPAQIGYILCFIDGKTGNPLPPFDPIMDNGGGGRT